MAVIRSIVSAGLMSASLLICIPGSGGSLCFAQQRDGLSLTLQTGSPDDMRGASSVFVFTGSDAGLGDRLRDEVKGSSLEFVGSYDEADLILMIVPEGTGTQPDWGVPSSLKETSATGPLSAAILRRVDDRTVKVIYQARFAAGERDAASRALLDRFHELLDGVSAE